MPSVRKLTPEETQQLEDNGKGTRKLTEERYDRAIANFGVGDYGELIPDVGENRLTSRNRLKAAAARRGLSLTFIRTTGEAMRFKVDENTDNGAAKPVRRVPEPQPEPEPAPVAPPAKKRGGRPKKVVD